MKNRFKLKQGKNDILICEFKKPKNLVSLSKDYDLFQEEILNNVKQNIAIDNLQYYDTSTAKATIEY